MFINSELLLETLYLQEVTFSRGSAILGRLFMVYSPLGLAGDRKSTLL